MKRQLTLVLALGFLSLVAQEALAQEGTQFVRSSTTPVYAQGANATPRDRFLSSLSSEQREAYFAAHPVDRRVHLGRIIDTGPINGTAEGCGSIGTQWVPDVLFGVNTRPACDRHDACYSNPNMTQQRCDQNLRDDIIRDNRGNMFAVPVAENYNRVLNRVGRDAYQAAQAETAARQVPPRPQSVVNPTRPVTSDSREPAVNVRKPGASSQTASLSGLR